MIGTEQEALAHAVTECATNGTEWEISTSDGALVWNIERDSKVDNDDLTWPVIVHLRGAMSDEVAILTEVVTPREP